MHGRDGSRHEEFDDPQVHVLRDVSELEHRLDDWTDLARESLEPNAFWEPFFLLPALAHLGHRHRFRLVTVEVAERRSGRRALGALFPFELRRYYRGAPIPVLSLWRHRYAFLATPLIRASCAGICLDALCTWHARGPFRRGLLELGDMHGGGPVMEALTASAARVGHLVVTTDSYRRAFLQPARTADRYMADAIAARRRKEYRRQLNRLRDRGSVAFSDLAANDDAEPWLRAFLTLERAGWKGRRGSAMLSRGHDGFFEAMGRGAHANGQLIMSRLTLDGRPVAMSCQFVSGGGAFAFKIAYDETLARYSPGVLLALHTLRLLHDREDVAWADSCGKPGNMLTPLWTGRREIRTVIVGSNRFPSHTVARAAGTWRRLTARFSGLPPSPGDRSLHVPQPGHASDVDTTQFRQP